MLHIPRPLFVPVFSVRVALLLALLLIVLKNLTPSIWARNLEAGILIISIAFVFAIGVNCINEWIFHRWVLHAKPHAWAQHPADKHREHHRLTSVELDKSHDPSVVVSNYAIMDADQYIHAQFPWWALPAFWAVYAIPLFGVQLMVPTVPILVPGFIGVAFTVWFYEVNHFVEHLPYPMWQRMFRWPYIGRLMQRAYGFHLMHHAHPKINEGIAGFFGIKLADRLFGTYYLPPKLLVDGIVATAADFQIPKPRAIVRWVDKIVDERERHITNVPK